MSSPQSAEEDKTIFRVVVNEEEQYSIWPEYKDIPGGWSDVGKLGPKADCLSYINEVWTDLRPLSLRKKMEELVRNPPARPASTSQPQEQESLVDRLCAGDHPLVLSQRPESSVRRFKEALDDGYLRLKFTDTSPGTELGLRLDRDACDLEAANFEEGIGRALIVGNLTLDY
jgi:uncharacterized protein YbdZ (MbtH family)